MKVLGLSSGFIVNMHDSAAVLVEDGVILAAAEEERFSRAKHGRGELAERAARWMIEEYGPPDAIAYHCCGAPWMADRIYDWAKRKLDVGCPPVHLLNHHSCHAASAFYPSPFDRANILTMDHSGDGLATTLSYGEGETIHRLDDYESPNSLGKFYAMATDHLGYNTDADEYHVMGMAAHGDSDRFYERLRKVLNTAYGTGLYWLNPAYIQTWEGCHRGHQERLVSNKWIAEFGPRRQGEFTEDHMDFAAAAQRVFTEAVVQLVERLHSLTGIRNLVLAGGCALNCRANQAIRELDCVDELWVQPASSDAGAALGAALLVDKKRVEMTHAYLGPDVGHLEDFQIEAAAERLARGEIIGWMQGRMEYGPRALGNRSILALPTEENRTRVGEIKGREQFRPFAPVVTAKLAGRYFDGGGTWSMTQTFRAYPHTIVEAPGVVHKDGTARVQTVTAKQNKALHLLLCMVGDRTGCPILLNTSFNVRGQPIVCTAADAIGTFYATDLDALFVGDRVLSK